MQLLFSSTIPVVEFSSVSLLLKDSPDVGESIMVASPLSTTPFSYEAVLELQFYLLSIQQFDTNVKSEELPSSEEQLATDDMRQTTPQVFRCQHSGLAMYYWIVRDHDFIHNAFSVLMTAKDRYKSDKVDGVLVCVGVSGLYSMQPSSPLVRTLVTRLQDIVLIMRGMRGDAEECKSSYKALMTTLLLTEDEERRTNGMVESEQVTMELDFESTEKDQRKLSGKKSRSFGMKRGVSSDMMNAKMATTSSADLARLLEKRSAVLSVVEKGCNLRKYDVSRKETISDKGSKPRRRKGKTDEIFKDFDYTSPQQARTQVAEVAAAAARLRPATPVAKKPAILVSTKDLQTASRKIVRARPPNPATAAGLVLAPPRSTPTAARRGSQKKRLSQQKEQMQQAQQIVQRQAAFNVFDIENENDTKLGRSFGIDFPGLDSGLDDNRKEAAKNVGGFPNVDNHSRSPPSRSSFSSAPSRNLSTASGYSVQESVNSGPGGNGGFAAFSFEGSSTPEHGSASRRSSVNEYDERNFDELDAPELTEEQPATPNGENSDDGNPRLLVNLALNEDLTCSYKQSKISSCTIEGVVQVQVKSDAQKNVPFFLLLRDPSHHIRMIQENRRYANDVTETLLDSNEEDTGVDYKFTITVPRAENYFPVMRYKCSPELRPVPIRVQTRVRTSGGFCRVALQISSNPANEDDLTDLTIIMGVPAEVRGESLATFPAGGVWNAAKRSVIWCVAELGDGEKFQLQAQFEIIPEHVEEAERDKPKFPVLVRCQCMYAQLSDIELEVADMSGSYPADISMKFARRFRLSHRERS